MNDAITRPLAALMAGLHPGWQPAGCAQAIHDARNMAPLHELAHAAIDYAMRADVKTPGLFAQDGPHWHTGRTPNARVQRTRCTVDGHEYEWADACRLCPVERCDPSPPTTLAISPDQARINTEGAALVRARLAQAPTPEPYTDRQMAAAGDVDA